MKIVEIPQSRIRALEAALSLNRGEIDAAKLERILRALKTA
ncbi:MAG TPA: hypothetical protein VE693_03475 [Gaiellaceae bacterium]|jgi:hypothetical protein|nr:hypothetical protein [Gaiellaceae bacterium]